MLEILLATTGSATLPVFKPDQEHYPVNAIRQGQSAAALVELTVDPEGKLVGCKMVGSFGSESLAEDICDLQKRAEFQAARSQSGEATFGVLRVLVKYTIAFTDEGREIHALQSPGYTAEVSGFRMRRGSRMPNYSEFLASVGSPKFIVNPDFVLKVASLPGVDGSQVHQSVIAEVDEAGRVVSCEADEKFDSSGIRSKFADAACAQLAEAPIEQLNVAGDAVHHVRRVEVRFEIEQSDAAGG